ncbi:MAG: hypothetical protein M1561_06715 [Gammaproteobacteria bacterium]|nr:hypothetical protein [Gammaproteobacteria bacterium]
MLEVKPEQPTPVASFRLIPFNLSAAQIDVVIDMIKKISFSQSTANLPFISRQQIEYALKNEDVGKVIEACLDTLATNQNARNLVLSQINEINTQLLRLRKALNEKDEYTDTPEIHNLIDKLNENKRKLKVIQSGLEAEVPKYNEYMRKSQKEIQDVLRSYAQKLADDLKNKYNVELSPETINDIVNYQKTFKQVLNEFGIEIEEKI